MHLSIVYQRGERERELSFDLLEISVIHKLVTFFEDLKVVIQLSGRFIYPDDFAGDQSVRINEARLYIKSDS
jgi:hypothetical protein